MKTWESFFERLFYICSEHAIFKNYKDRKLSPFQLGFDVCPLSVLTRYSGVLGFNKARSCRLQVSCSSDSLELHESYGLWMPMIQAKLSPQLRGGCWSLDDKACGAFGDGWNRTLLMKDSPAVEGQGGSRCEGKIQVTTWTSETPGAMEGGGKSADIWQSVQRRDLRGGGRHWGFQRFLTFCLPAWN